MADFDVFGAGESIGTSRVGVGTFVAPVDQSGAARARELQAIGSAVATGTQLGLQQQRSQQVQEATSDLVGGARSFTEVLSEPEIEGPVQAIEATEDITRVAEAVKRDPSLRGKAQIQINKLVRDKIAQNPEFEREIIAAAKGFVAEPVSLGSIPKSQGELKVEQDIKLLREEAGEVAVSIYMAEPALGTQMVERYQKDFLDAQDAVAAEDLGASFTALPADQQNVWAGKVQSRDVREFPISIANKLGIDAENFQQLTNAIETMPVEQRNQALATLQADKAMYLSIKGTQFDRDAVPVNTKFAPMISMYDNLIAVADGSQSATTMGNVLKATEDSYKLKLYENQESAQLMQLKTMLQGVDAEFLAGGAKVELGNLFSQQFQKILANKPERDIEDNDAHLHNTGIETKDKQTYIDELDKVIASHKGAQSTTAEQDSQVEDYVLDIFTGMGYEKTEASTLAKIFNVTASVDWDKLTPEGKAEVQMHFREGLDNYITKVQRDLTAQLRNIDGSLGEAIKLSVSGGDVRFVLDEQAIVADGSPLTPPSTVSRMRASEIRDARALVRKFNQRYRFSDMLRATKRVFGNEADQAAATLFPTVGVGEGSERELPQETRLGPTPILQTIGGWIDRVRQHRESVRVGGVSPNGVAVEADVSPQASAVMQIETGGESDPYIRTRVALDNNFSTAYGPMQVTGTLARDYVDRKADLFTPDELEYLDRFIDQADMFAEFKNTRASEGRTGAKRFGLGGTGILTSEQDKRMYDQVMSKIFEDRTNGSSDPDEIARLWLGGTEEQNRAYAQKLRKHLN